MKRLISLLVVLLAFGATAYAETATGKVTAASSSCLATNCTELELPIDASAASILITGSATVGVISAGSYMIPVTGDLTFNIGSNSVNSATATCKLFFAKRVYPLS